VSRGFSDCRCFLPVKNCIKMHPNLFWGQKIIFPGIGPSHLHHPHPLDAYGTSPLYWNPKYATAYRPRPLLSLNAVDTTVLELLLERYPHNMTNKYMTSRLQKNDKSSTRLLFLHSTEYRSMMLLFRLYVTINRKTFFVKLCRHFAPASRRSRNEVGA